RNMEFKIRASSANKIMAEPPKTKVIYSVDGKEITTAKYNKIVDSALLTGDMSAIQHVDIVKIDIDDNLSAGAKTYCKEWLTETIFNRREEIKSRYIDKGNQTEEEALNLMVRVLKTGMLYKNEER